MTRNEKLLLAKLTECGEYLEKSAEEIIKLRGQLEQAQAELVTAKADGIREAIIECGLRKHYTGFTYIDEEDLLEHLYELDKVNKDNGSN